MFEIKARAVHLPRSVGRAKLLRKGMGHRRGLLAALALSALFTIALVYATVEIPAVADSLLKRVFPDYGLTFE
jgi:hypothetical protein